MVQVFCNFHVLVYDRTRLYYLTYLRIAVVLKCSNAVYLIIHVDIFVEKKKHGSTSDVASPEVLDFNVKSEDALI